MSGTCGHVYKALIAAKAMLNSFIDPSLTSLEGGCGSEDQSNLLRLTFFNHNKHFVSLLFNQLQPWLWSQAFLVDRRVVRII